MRWHRWSFIAQALVFVSLAGILERAAAAACGDPGDPNLVENCDLTTATVADYSVAQGSCVHNSGVGATAPGSMLCDAASDGFGGFRFVVKQCITDGLAPNTTYGLAVDARYNSGTNVATCVVGAADTPEFDCTNISGSTFSASWAPGTTHFTQSAAVEYTTGGTVGAALIQVTCSVGSPGGVDFTVFLDDFFFGTGLVPLFADGFESGLASDWDAVVGD